MDAFISAAEEEGPSPRPLPLPLPPRFDMSPNYPGGPKIVNDRGHPFFHFFGLFPVFKLLPVLDCAILAALSRL
jgi:hypothetical protein